MELYKKLFEISRRYIEDSKTNPKLDLHRVTDMYDSVGANQIASKQWLVDEAIQYLNQDDIIMVAGAWYGVLSHLLKESGFADNTIYNVDIDPVAKEIGKKLFPETVFVCDDGINFYMERRNWFTVLINTSTEHMEPDEFELLVRSKPEDTLLICQSNNNWAEDEHINCHDGPNELAEACKLKHIYYQDSREFVGKWSQPYSRHMVIGR